VGGGTKKGLRNGGEKSKVFGTGPPWSTLIKDVNHPRGKKPHRTGRVFGKERPIPVPGQPPVFLSKRVADWGDGVFKS